MHACTHTRARTKMHARARKKEQKTDPWPCARGLAQPVPPQQPTGDKRCQETTGVKKTRATPKGEHADQAHLTGREHETAVLPQASKAGLERDCCREEQGEEARQRGGGGGSVTERRRRRRDREETEREQEETCQLSRAGRTSRWYATALPSSSFPL